MKDTTQTIGVAGEQTEKTEAELLHEEVKDAIADREPAEERDAVFYEMRHSGLRRRDKQPWQADMHLPLSDAIISKKKPYYFEQLYATEHVASFAAQSMDPKARSGTLSAARWFDYKVKEETNFEDQCLILIDLMLQSGRTVKKVVWDGNIKQLVCTALDWTRIIVPTGTALNWTLTNRPLWLVEVLDLSVREYKREKNYDQDKELIAKIRGGGDAVKTMSKEDAKRQRAGLTYSDDNNRIILWLLWELSEDGKTWTVHTYNPLAGPEEGKVREPYKAQTGGWLPYFDFHKEVKDNDWLSSRGVPERMGMFERAGSSVWNVKVDCLRFYSSPVFRTTNGQPANNSMSKRWKPGQVYEDGREKIDMGNPPVALDVELNNIRVIAENLEGVPDMAMGGQGNTRDPRTATEIDKITALFSRNIGMDGRTFRRRMREVLKFMWFLYNKHARQARGFFFQDEYSELDGQIFKVDYKIEPAGGVEAFSKEMQYTKAVMLFNLLKGDPYITQPELRRMLLEAVEPALIKRLYADPRIDQGDEAERQALEIAAMENGAVVRVKPGDNDAVHVGAILDFMNYRAKRDPNPDPDLRQRLQMHLMGHLTQAKQKDPKAGGQLEKRVVAMLSPKKAAPSTNGRNGAMPMPAAGRVAA